MTENLEIFFLWFVIGAKAPPGGGFKLAAFGVKQGGIGSLLAGGIPTLKKTSTAVKSPTAESPQPTAIPPPTSPAAATTTQQQQPEKQTSLPSCKSLLFFPKKKKKK